MRVLRTASDSHLYMLILMYEFVYYFPDEAVLTDHCYWFGPWYWYYYTPPVTAGICFFPNK